MTPAGRVMVLCVTLVGCTDLFSKPRPYACRLDGGPAQCDDGWVCGLEGVCHPMQAGAWQCEPDAGNGPCFGWHCGLEGRCYDRAEGQAHPCVPELEAQRNDCPVDWRCGLERRCHPSGVTTALLCSK